MKCKLDRIAQEIRDNFLTTFTFQQAQEWSESLGLNSERPSVVIAELKKRGMTMEQRQPPKKFRTIGSNPHDRWQASPTHGGGGGTCIVGMASEG